MLVLGWHGGVRAGETDDQGFGYSTHDGAAVLLRDGEIVAAIEEERLNRVKHSNFFPARAIRFCLERGGVSLADVDFIAFDAQEEMLDAFAAYCALANPDEPLVPGRQWLASLFAREFTVDVTPKLRFCGHHLAHLAGAVHCSGQSRGLAVALDGEGDRRSGMIATFQDGSITPLREYSADQSLGAFYTSMISLLGYKRFDEYKVMGLAPYGNSARYESLFNQFYTLLPDGDVSIIPDAAKLQLIAASGLLPHLRRKGQPFTDLHKDLASSIQQAFERLAMHVFTHFRTATGESSLCYSGGAAHNCTFNGRLLYSGLFKELFIQPAAHDAGNALGAALAIAREEGGSIGRPRQLPHLFLGADIGADAFIRRRLDAWSEFVSYERADDVAGRSADLLAEGAVIGWVQGRSEFGPRALGNRSILADARPARFKDVINRMVKKREGYRPFAPSVLEERLPDFFEAPHGQREFPFMIFILKVRDEVRELLGAITHVDGTARVQTVNQAANPRYHALISAFEKRTGVPVLLNTSFNNHAEPIVDSVDDAIVCFLTTGINYLVVGDFIVTKRDVPGDRYARLVPGMPTHRKLVKRSTADGGQSHTIDSTASGFFVEKGIEISRELFAILVEDDRAQSVAQRCEARGVKAADLVPELLDLWGRRAITLAPA
jgi:carbamoyltransferase